MRAANESMDDEVMYRTCTDGPLGAESSSRLQGVQMVSREGPGLRHLGEEPSETLRR